MSSFIQKNTWLVAGFLYLLLIIYFANIPVFWDMYAQVHTAHYFLQTHFSDLFPNGGFYTDNGYFPLYAVYLAVCFKYLGFQLWVAHLSVFPFVLALFFQIQRFCASFFSFKKTAAVLGLMLIHPILLMQSVYFSSEIALAFACFWLLNSLINNRASHIVLASVFLCALNLRSLPFIFLLGVYFLFFKKKKEAWYLVFSFLLAAIWLFYHYLHTGWLIQNPESVEYRRLIGVPKMLQNVFCFFIHFFNYGNGVIVALLMLFLFFKKRGHELGLFAALFAVSVLLCCIPLSNPINARYFLPVYLFFIPCLVWAIGFLSLKKNSLFLFVYLLALWQTQFVTPPEKYGYSWDCSFQSLAYFEVQKQVDAYLTERDIKPKEVDAGYQLNFDDAFYLMNNKPKQYAWLSDTDMPTNKYVLQSNICNNYSAERNGYIQQQYVILQSFKKGWVCIDVYKKKSF
ncbi:MAG: hypothetical protein JST67_05445 [Bacteroidetes bacterium]|nr:hypothetical protein [Bacteroidota bacterium]